MSTPLERDIEKRLTRQVTLAGGLCLKWVCPGWAGVPDRIILLPGGRVIFAELKRSPEAAIAARQIWWGKKLTALGFDHRLIRSHEDVKRFELEVLKNVG